VIYAIGDIHGEIAKLEQMLSILRRHLAPEDTLVFIGDYIDRGPNTPAVLDRVMELVQTRPNTIALRGNHEQMMLDARAFFDPNWSSGKMDEDIGGIWFYNGAQQTIEQFMPQASKETRFWERVPERYWDFLKGLPLEYELGPFLFVHAGIVPKGMFWDEAPLDPRLWIRDIFLTSKQDFGKIVVFGHTPLKRPIAMENKIGIDTGAAYGGKLTAAILNPAIRYDPAEVDFIQV